MNETPSPEHATATLADAFAQFLHSLRADNRLSYERYVRHYVQTVGEDQTAETITGPRVERYAEGNVKSTDPLAEARVTALKAWFQYLKKHNYTSQNFGTVIRLRRASRSRPAVSAVASDIPTLAVTPEGLTAMKEEFGELQQEVPALIEAIALAREDKDFRENAPLDAAREALAQNEARRRQLEGDIRRARVVEDDSAGERVAVGSSVTVTRLDSGKQFTYRLVGAREANAREGKISVDSPVGMELLGKSVDDEATVATPAGEMMFRVDSIEGLS